MSNGTFSFKPNTKESDKKNENDRSKILIALFFLLLSFSCIFCSSQGALWFISEDRVDASILSNRMADYNGNLVVAAAPLNRDLLATEIYQDDILLQQTVTTSGVGNAVVVGIPTPLDTPTPIPVAQLLPTLTPTSVPPPTATPNPTSPPVSTVPPTAIPPPTPIPATLTPEPPTPVPSTPIPPTPIPPTPTDIIPTPTDPPPTSPPPTSPPPTSPPANNPPTAVNDTATTDEDTPVVINVIANDFDNDGAIDPTTVTIISGPANGGTIVNGTTGQVTYTPNGNYSGNDSFTYRVCDNDGACATAIVSITVNPVNDPPLAVDDVSNTANSLPVTIAVLANDSDLEGGPLSVIAVGGLSGTIGINIDNTVTYTPTVGLTGIHVFTYTIRDNGGLTDGAVVSVTVTTPPVAVDDNVIVSEDLPASIDVLNNDSDLDGDPLSVTFVSVPGHGTAVINIPGYIITYVPSPNYNGPDTFTYIISDGIYTDTATVNITVLPVNDPPVAVDDTYSTPVSSTLTIAAPGLLNNDSDIDSPSLSVDITSVTPPSGGAVGVSADGGFIYTAPSVAGVYTFTYNAQDTLLAPSNVAIVTIQVTSP